MNAPPPSPTPIKCRGQTIIFRPPKHINVAQIILKNPNKPSQAVEGPSTQLTAHNTEEILSSQEKQEARMKRKRKPSWIIKTGNEYPYQTLELFSSSDSSDPSSGTTSTHHGRSKSVSPFLSPRIAVPVSSASERAATLSPVLTEPMNWIEFTDITAAYEEYGSIAGYDTSPAESFGTSSTSEDGSTMIITPEASQASSRLVLTPMQLATLFHQPVYSSLPTPPPTPPTEKVRRASKSPDLPTIPASTPTSPYQSKPMIPISPSSQSAPGRIFGPTARRRGHSLDGDVDMASSSDNDVTVMKSDKEDKQDQNLLCSACGTRIELKKAKKMIPCGHITCSACFSSTLSAVSPDRIHSQCVACAGGLTTFEKIKNLDQRDGSYRFQNFSNYEIPVAEQPYISVVMRIDNIAWDVTPEIVEHFLPKDTLSTQVAQAIHIPLDRFDGRTKDYLYVEVSSLEAAKKTLQSRQNSYMPGGPGTGGKKRPVTITIVSHAELITELRPRSSQELHCLLHLCHLALGPPIAAARFVKSRHGPFYALMSIMSKLSGKQSPAYWDLFHVTSG
uniref:RING-type domain-containing protein n=1 Tax=Kwoniella dejecticola CBS 10117 TaxID=1296121 RepID=A0A1A6A5A4_9TREE|nr:uncharacterized protein I303_04569 [Kwoniella dejecticola CBS 10117]OBR85236.1 hypothetical protein I303_04569 [Kwoniella dejecticola CBS 10117]